MLESQTRDDAAAPGAPAAVAARLSEQISGGDLVVPMLPEVATQVMSMAQADDSNAAGLSVLIQRDAGLAGHVMRMANSAAYSPRSKIVSLQQAIAWLGIKEVGQIAFAIAVRSKLFDVPGQRELMQSLWRQALASGLWAREIARMKRLNVETAYLCGLLHDIGRPALVQMIGETAKELGDAVSRDQTLALLDRFAPDAAERIGSQWQLPEAVMAAMRSWRDTEAHDEHDDAIATTQCAHRFAEFTLASAEWTREMLSEIPVLVRLNLYAEEVDELLDKSEQILRTVEAS